MQINPATSRPQVVRWYSVEDDGDGCQLLLVEDGYQVGGALVRFDLLGEDAAFDLANTLGQTFVASARPRSAGLS